MLDMFDRDSLKMIEILIVKGSFLYDGTNRKPNFETAMTNERFSNALNFLKSLGVVTMREESNNKESVLYRVFLTNSPISSAFVSILDNLILQSAYRNMAKTIVR